MRLTIGIAVTALTLTIGATPAVAAPPAYTFMDLGTLGGESSYASALNDRGEIVGSSQVADGSWHGFHWRAGKMTDLGELRPVGINNKGDIIGTTDTSAYLRRGTRLIDLGPGLYPIALNDRSQVIGVAATPVLWTAGKLRPLPLGSVSGINQAGQISGSTGSHAAVLWRGRITDLGAGPFDRSNANGINDNGWIIGWHFSETQYERGILWRSGQPTDVGTLGGESTHLAAINNRGQVLGRSRLPDGVEHTVLWQGGTLSDLTGRGVDPDHDLVDLNNRGEIAVSFRPVFGVSHAGLYR